MKKVITLVVALAMLLPAVLAIDTGIGTGITIDTEDFEPRVWMCDSRVVRDDYVEWGRTSLGGDELLERTNNYAFEGEQISWKILVMDKNGIEKIEDVYVTVGEDGEGPYMEANCKYDGCGHKEQLDDSCNARIDEEELDECNPDVMGYYQCTFTVESPASMHGEYWVTATAEDLTGLTGTMDEREYWFFNPVIALTMNGGLSFDEVRPGTDSYSSTMTVGNGAESGSGVMLDMFISGTDFYDSEHSGAKCPNSNVLRLSNLRYHAVNGAYSTADDGEDDDDTYDPATDRDRDDEGYVNIQYGDRFEKAMYDEAEIIQEQRQGPYWVANTLSPGSEMSLTFKLSLPEPCNGNFDQGSIFFWGEAI